MRSLPNALTISRIAVIPVLVGLIFIDTPLCRWLALAGFTLACATDYFDGWLARNQNTVSQFGRFLDPIADKVLVAALIVALAESEGIAGATVFPAIVILAREILVSGLREYLAEIKVPMPVTKLAKWKTTIQMVALGFLIVGTAAPEPIPAVLIGDAGLWCAAFLTLVTGYDYFMRGFKHMMAGDGHRK